MLLNFHVKLMKDNLNFFDKVANIIKNEKRPLLIFPQGTRVKVDDKVPFKKGVENKQKIMAEERLKKTIASIDLKMQQPYWDALVFDDQELQLLSNFGETIKFPHENTAVRALSVLATYILKKEVEEDLFT